MPEKIVLIGAGLPRTGTASLRKALSRLLGGECYHMFQVFQGIKEDLDYWDELLDDDELRRDSKRWSNILEKRGFTAGIDFPIALYYRELMELYPDAKVLLSVRDNPEVWYVSVRDSIFRWLDLTKEILPRCFLALIGKLRTADLVMRISCHPPTGYKLGLFGSVAQGQEESVAFYNRWNDEVRRVVPRERLLEFNVKQGWKPLCDFLGVPVPEDEAFPHENETLEMQKMQWNVRFMSFIVIGLGLPILLAGGFYFLRKIAF